MDTKLTMNSVTANWMKTGNLAGWPCHASCPGKPEDVIIENDGAEPDDSDRLSITL